MLKRILETEQQPHKKSLTLWEFYKYYLSLFLNNTMKGKAWAGTRGVVM